MLSHVGGSQSPESLTLWLPIWEDSSDDLRTNHKFKVTDQRANTLGVQARGADVDTSDWMPNEKQKLKLLQQGQTVVTNITTDDDSNLMKYAQRQGDYVYCGRKTNGDSKPWGNPYVMNEDGGKDGDRDEVCDEHKANFPPEELMRVYQLKGKVLGCYCQPKRCHCDYLAELANSLE